MNISLWIHNYGGHNILFTWRPPLYDFIKLNVTNNFTFRAAIPQYREGIRNFTFRADIWQYNKPKFLCWQSVNLTTCSYRYNNIMMTSLNGNISRVTGPLWGGIHRSPVHSPHKGPWRGTLMFLLSAPEQTVEQTIERPVIWDAISLIMTSL